MTRTPYRHPMRIVHTKSAWEFGGYLQANAAFFFQDYTDKQLSTQILVAGEQQPRVLNAGGARIWVLSCLSV